jgi:hypothetical protein
MEAGPAGGGKIGRWARRLLSGLGCACLVAFAPLLLILALNTAVCVNATVGPVVSPDRRMALVGSDGSGGAMTVTSTSLVLRTVPTLFDASKPGGGVLFCHRCDLGDFAATWVGAGSLVVSVGCPRLTTQGDRWRGVRIEARHGSIPGAYCW